MRELALIILLGAFGVGLIIAAWVVVRRPPKRVSAEMDDSAFIRWLTMFERGYTRSSAWSRRALTFCRNTPIVIGLLVPVVLMLKDDSWTIMGVALQRNIVVIALTGISTVCVAILTQMGVAQLARAREVSRINCAELVARAKLFFSIERTPEEAYAEKVRIKDEIFKIEHGQAGFFGGEIAAEIKQGESEPLPQQAASQPQPDRIASAAAAPAAGAVRDPIAPDRAARVGALVSRLSKSDPTLSIPERELEMTSTSPQASPG